MNIPYKIMKKLYSTRVPVVFAIDRKNINIAMALCFDPPPYYCYTLSHTDMFCF